MPYEFQKSFRESVFDPTRPPIAEAVSPEGRAAPKRFGVYRNNVIVSLIGAMGDGFPLCKKIVGDVFFDALAREFITNSPPKSPLMFEYGADFPQFLEAFPPARQVPYLADMARLEYLRRKSYFAEDRQCLKAGWAAQYSEDRLMAARLALHPASFTLASRYPIHALYLRNHDDVKSEIENKAEEVLISRPKMTVKVEAAPTGTALFFKALSRGSFGASLEAVIEQYPSADIPNLVALALAHTVEIKE